MTTLWFETDMAKRKPIAQIYDNKQLQDWGLSPRTLNALRRYNPKITIGDVIRADNSIKHGRTISSNCIQELQIKVSKVFFDEMGENIELWPPVTQATLHSDLPATRSELSSQSYESSQRLSPNVFLQLEQISNITEQIRKILVNVLIILVGIVVTIILVSLVYIELAKDIVVIRGFEVTKELEEQGFTNQVLANKLLDVLTDIRVKANTTWKPRDFGTAEAINSFDIEIEGAGISMKSILQYIKDALGWTPIYIAGEITRQGNENGFDLTIRVSEKPAKIIPGTLANLDNSLFEAAKYIYKYTDPFILASYLYRTGHSDESLKIIQDCISNISPDDDKWAYDLWGLILVERKDFERAFTKYEKAQEIDPDFDLAFNDWGNALLEKGDYEEAINKYQRARESNPSNILTYLNWGNALYAQGKYQEAQSKYEEAREADVNNAWVYSSLGDALRAQNNDGADSNYQKALQLDPYLASKYLTWGTDLYNQGNCEEAEAKYQTAVDLDPNYSGNYNTKDYESYSQKQYTKVLVLPPKSPEEFAFDPESYNYSNYEYYYNYDYTGYYYDALHNQQEDTKTVAKNQFSVAYTNWGDCLFSQGHYDQAVDKYQTALNLSPNFALVYLNWGNTLDVQGDYAGAIAKYQKALELDPQNVLAYLYWGSALYNQGDYAGAIAKYQESLKFNDKNTLAYLYWGNALTAQKDYTGAIAKYQKVLDLDPTNIWAIASRGETYRIIGNYDQSLVDLNRAIEFNPNNAWSLASRGDTYRAMGHYDKAMTDLDRAIQLNENYDFAFYTRGLLYKEKGEKDKAISDFKRFLQLSDDPNGRQQVEEQLKALEAK